MKRLGLILCLIFITGCQAKDTQVLIDTDVEYRYRQSFSIDGNILRWNFHGEEGFLIPQNRKLTKEELLLDEFPDVGNKEDIINIEFYPDERLAIYTKDKCWLLNYNGTPGEDWYVKDFFYYN